MEEPKSDLEVKSQVLDKGVLDRVFSDSFIRTLLIIAILSFIGFSILLVWFRFHLNEYFMVECARQLGGSQLNISNFSNYSIPTWG